MITKQDLLQAKTRALRLKIWFRALSRTERAIMDLTLKCVERIRSSILEATIYKILDKLLKALENIFLINAEKVGNEIARRMCQIAQKWGNKSASAWEHDKVFIRFLGINAVNAANL